MFSRFGYKILSTTKLLCQEYAEESSAVVKSKPYRKQVTRQRCIPGGFVLKFFEKAKDN